MNSAAHLRREPTVDHFFLELWHSAAEVLAETTLDEEVTFNEDNVKAQPGPKPMIADVQVPDWDPNLGPGEVLVDERKK